MTKKQLTERLEKKCDQMYGCKLSEANDRQLYKVLCTVTREELEDDNRNFSKKVRDNEQKQVYYLSMEFLVGTSLYNNLFNLGLLDDAKKILEDLGTSLDNLTAIDPDAGLGNGGLGRLASCYMDAATSMNVPMTGFSIRYEFGIFKQKIIDGWQVEQPDNWLTDGGVWLNTRQEDAVEIKFGGECHEWMDNGQFRVANSNYESVIAIPHDLYISGYNTKSVNKLVLWSASKPQAFDMNAFSRGDYMRALEDNTMAEVISKVLYPADNHINGKKLRLRQQYFFVSASLQTIISDHLKKYHTLSNLADKVAIHINDTHPALCVPELMRLLMDEHGMGWDEAWDICSRTLAYTNHTVMSEALEHWNISLFREQLPRCYSICEEINRRLMEKLAVIYPNDPGKWNYMAVIANGDVNMPNLCLACCHKVNGVSALHTDIIKDTLFHDYYNINHDQFTSVTNGISYRRWLAQANPELTAYIKELIGDGFMKDADELEKLLKFKGDETVLAKLNEIKKDNKVRLGKYIAKANGINVDPESIFDVQIKRLHEYKRQLLNVLHVLKLYNEIKANPNADWTPKTFVFGAKASAGYAIAKQTISLIHAVSKFISNDPAVRDIIKVVFIENYSVSLAELIIPAADISEQISNAGKEASGTSNMKLMMNGAVTLGTLDGANVEIRNLVGDENMFLFGLTTEQVNDLWRQGYDPRTFITPDIQKVLNMLTSGVLGQTYPDILDSLLTGRFGPADRFMTIADFKSYYDTHMVIDKTYADRMKFADMSLVNIAKSGFFSADRAVKEYVDRIWEIKKY